jgi:hypothetical protein
MTDDIFTTDQDILSNVLLSDDDTDFADDDLTTGGLDPLDLDEEDPDAVEEDSYDDNDDF